MWRPSTSQQGIIIIAVLAEVYLYFVSDIGRVPFLVPSVAGALFVWKFQDEKTE